MQTRTTVAIKSERIRLNTLLLCAVADQKALNKVRGPLGHGVIFRADKAEKAAQLDATIASLRNLLAQLDAA